MPRINIEEFERIQHQRLPFTEQMGLHVDSIGDGVARCRARYNESFLRPGGTIAGPIMMGLADFCMYAVVLGMIGPVELAVTTNLNINFLRKPPPADLIAEGRIIKLGKRLAVGEVLLLSEGDPEPVAHVTCTYSIPPRNDSGH